MTISLFDRIGNTVGKGENPGYQHFLLFPQCFPEPELSDKEFKDPNQNKLEITKAEPTKGRIDPDCEFPFKACFNQRSRLNDKKLTRIVGNYEGNVAKDH